MHYKKIALFVMEILFVILDMCPKNQLDRKGRVVSKYSVVNKQ